MGAVEWPAPTAVLSVHPNAKPARRLYEGRGWTILTEEFRTQPGQSAGALPAQDRPATTMRTAAVGVSWWHVVSAVRNCGEFRSMPMAGVMMASPLADG